MKAKREYSWIGTVLLLLAACCILSVVLFNFQASMALPLQQVFTGEYSRDGETWYPLDDRSELSALDGDLILRGHFSYDISEDGRLYYYQNHIGIAVYLNGELIWKDTITEFEEHGLDLLPSLCGSRWDYFVFPEISPEDEVEIHLCNPHAHGNSGAYRDFLNTLYNSPDTAYVMESYLKEYSLSFQVVGMILMIAALLLLGAALASGLLRIPLGGALWRYGLLSFFLGGFILLDTVGISFISELVVFNTYGRQICIMLAAYSAGLCVCDDLTGAVQKVARAATLLSALFDCVLIVISLSGVMVIYDTQIYWCVFQIVLSLLLIVCAAKELCRKRCGKRIELGCGILLQAAVLLDLAGVGSSIYSHGTCTKVMFLLIGILYTARAVKRIVSDRQASLRVKKLEKELEDSRIATMLSQIQPHFIYNTLGTIEQFCLEQPKAAAELVHDFSLYLRGNFSELDNAAPISLSQEIEHTRHYTNIEHIRFPDMEIKFELNSEDFLLPALTIQPLVENAIKHGLMGRESGGTVVVSSYETDKAYCVSVADDGVGFDTSISLEGRDHIGIKNIRGRVEAMCGGTLTVESTPGKGTTAVITIPKQGGETHERYHRG